MRSYSGTRAGIVADAVITVLAPRGSGGLIAVGRKHRAKAARTRIMHHFPACPDHAGCPEEAQAEALKNRSTT